MCKEFLENEQYKTTDKLVLFTQLYVQYAANSDITDIIVHPRSKKKRDYVKMSVMFTAQRFHCSF